MSCINMKLLFVASLVLMFSSCKSNEKLRVSHRSQQEDSSKWDQLRLTIITLAKEQVGKKYQRSSKGPNSYDCSGLVHYVYNRMELPVGASASDQCQQGKKIELDNAKKGDLIFFGGKDHITHVGIITENSKNRLMMVHSSSSRGVIEENVLNSDYWVRRIRHITSLTSYKKEKDISMKNR